MRRVRGDHGVDAGTSGPGKETGSTPGKRTLTETIQLRADRAAPTGAPIQQRAAAVSTEAAPAPTGTGSQLPGPLQAKMDGAFNFDFSAVRVHEGDQAAAMGAVAYTQGADLHFSRGQYDPGSRSGQELIGHELAHVVQQSEGRVPATRQFKGVDLNDDSALEHEADAWGARAAAGEPVARSASASQPGAHAPVQRKEGPIEHQGKVGAGTLTARKDDLDPSDKSNDNYSLEYAGKDADKAHWLQFVHRTMSADEPGTGKVFATGSVETTGGKGRPWTTPDTGVQWTVDSGSKSDPYYDAAGSNARDPGKSTKIFDEPGGPSWAGVFQQFVTAKAPKAAKATLVLSFDTYLVQDGKSTYHVSWTATTEYDAKAKTTGAIAYATGTAGGVAGLPKDLKKVLDAAYAGNKIT